jgi:hypothetical protein
MEVREWIQDTLFSRILSTGNNHVTMTNKSYYGCPVRLHPATGSWEQAKENAADSSAQPHIFYTERIGKSDF